METDRHTDQEPHKYYDMTLSNLSLTVRHKKTVNKTTEMLKNKVRLVTMVQIMFTEVFNALKSNELKGRERVCVCWRKRKRLFPIATLQQPKQFFS